MDVEPASAGIDALIERRAAARNNANALEEMYAKSTRRHREKIQREHAAAWHAFHLDQAVRLEKTAAELAAEHRARAEALLEDTGG